MNKMKSILLSISLLLTMAGCSGISIQAPANRFITPESKGEKFLKGGITIGVHANDEIKIISNRFGTTPTANPIIRDSVSTQLNGEITLIPRLDTYLNANFQSYNSVGLKLQILGSNSKEATAGNVSLALGGGKLFSSVKEDEDEEDGTGVHIKYKAKFDGYEYFALLGYRISERSLIYGGPWIARFDVDAGIDRTESGTTVKSIITRGEGEQQSAILGMEFGKTFVIKFEAAYTKTAYTAKIPSEMKADDKKSFVGGTSFSYYW